MRKIISFRLPWKLWAAEAVFSCIERDKMVSFKIECIDRKGREFQ